MNHIIAGCDKWVGFFPNKFSTQLQQMLRPIDIAGLLHFISDRFQNLQNCWTEKSGKVLFQVTFKMKKFFIFFFEFYPFTICPVLSCSAANWWYLQLLWSNLNIEWKTESGDSHFKINKAAEFPI